MSLIANGCSSRHKTEEIQKSFFNRNISFTIDPEAYKLMLQPEGLLSDAYSKAGEEIPLPDEIVAPFYHHADINNDRHISLQEAEIFCNDYSTRFLDSLGPVNYKPNKEK